MNKENPLKDCNKIDTSLMEWLGRNLQDFPEAIEFATNYRNYIHAIDDLIDMNCRPFPEDILRVAALASQTFSSAFWLRYSNILIVTEQLINNTYADSVEWEQAAEQYKRSAADTLRHAGLDMFYAVILICLGREKLRECSAQFRTQCYEIQSSKEDIK